jgi:hypothetical protein
MVPRLCGDKLIGHPRDFKPYGFPLKACGHDAQKLSNLFNAVLSPPYTQITENLGHTW